MHRNLEPSVSFIWFESIHLCKLKLAKIRGSIGMIVKLKTRRWGNITIHCHLWSCHSVIRIVCTGWLVDLLCLTKLVICNPSHISLIVQEWFELFGCMFFIWNAVRINFYLLILPCLLVWDYKWCWHAWLFRVSIFTCRVEEVEVQMVLVYWLGNFSNVHYVL